MSAELIRCPDCGTNGPHYCPADLCGPDKHDEQCACRECRSGDFTTEDLEAGIPSRA